MQETRTLLHPQCRAQPPLIPPLDAARRRPRSHGVPCRGVTSVRCLPPHLVPGASSPHTHPVRHRPGGRVPPPHSGRRLRPPPRPAPSTTPTWSGRFGAGRPPREARRLTAPAAQLAESPTVRGGGSASSSVSPTPFRTQWGVREHERSMFFKNIIPRSKVSQKFLDCVPLRSFDC